MKSVEFSGMWWLPGNPERTVAGSLSFNEENGIVLQLIGAFVDFQNFGESRTHPVLLGLTTNGKTITLVDCVGTNFSFSAPGFITEAYMAKFCFIGGHFENTAALQFRKFSVQYSHLPDWVRITGLTVTRHLDQHKMEASYELPQDLTAETSKGTILLSFSGNASGDGFQQFNFEQSVWFEIEAPTERSVQELLAQFVSPLQNLLTLATTKPNSITELNVFSSTVYLEKENKERVERPIRVVFRQHYAEAAPHKLLIPDYMLFTLHDVLEDFESVIEKWFEVASELDVVCNLFFAIQYTPTMHLENEFLNIVNALESYHRRRMKNEVQPKDEHAARVKRIINKVEVSDQEWLDGILAYSNEPRLEQRLNELLQKVHGVLDTVIEDDAKFAKRVKNTRNYLTHFDQRLKKRVARGSELFWLIRKLSYVLQLCLLLEVGLPLEKCAELLHRNQAFIQTPGLEERQG